MRSLLQVQFLPQQSSGVAAETDTWCGPAPWLGVCDTILRTFGQCSSRTVWGIRTQQGMVVSADCVWGAQPSDAPGGKKL